MPCCLSIPWSCEQRGPLERALASAFHPVPGDWHVHVEQDMLSTGRWRISVASPQRTTVCALGWDASAESPAALASRVRDAALTLGEPLG